MKKALFIFIILGLVAPTYASIDPHEYDAYRIPVFQTVEEYQSLVGDTVTFLPLANGHNDGMVWLFYQKSKKNPMRFVVQQIKGKKKKKGSNVQRTDWVIKDIKTHEDYKIVVYIGERKELEEKYSELIWADEVRNFDIPFYTINSLKKKAVGTEYTHPLVKASYIVIDEYIDVDYVYGHYESTHKVEVENSISHERHEYPYDHAEDSCFNEDLEKRCYTRLVKVEKPKDPNLKFGDIEVVTDSITKFRYVDDNIDIVIFGTYENFAFSIQNKSDYSIKIIWDDAVFVNANGTTSKIIHKDIKYSQKEASQPPTTIIRNARLEDIVIPADNIQYGERVREWVRLPIFPYDEEWLKSEYGKLINELDSDITRKLHTKVDKDKSYTVKLMLPIQIKDVINEYIFEFEITGEYLHPERLNL